MSEYIRLENEGGSKSRRNEQVARSEAECQSEAIDMKSRNPNGRDSSVGGGGSHPPYSPSFLVHNRDNVNSALFWAQGLRTMWDFMEYKVRVGKTNIILNKEDNPYLVKIIQAKWKSRYFNDGRLHMSRKIRKRLGRYANVKGLMQTLTYDIKKISKMSAWCSFGKDTRRFINTVNQYRYRRGWRRLHYFWVVEVQPGTGYPHVHMFFPNLKWLAPYSIIDSSWGKGRTNLEKPKKITVSCAGYISKYLRKLEGWSDLHLSMLWNGHCRMYSFSRGFFNALEKKESGWKRWQIIETDNLDEVETTLLKGGYVIDVNLAS